MKLSVGLGTLKLFLIMSSTRLNYYTTAEFTCPDVSYIEDSALMNCSMSTPYISLQYTGPRSTPGPQCIASLQLCTPIEGYNASIINQTHSSLRILTVEPHHAGQWTCADIPNGPLASCDVVITKTPMCSITSTEDTDVLAQYQQLALKVDIRGYFCSAAFHFSLQTGNVSTLLLGAEHVANVTDNITAVTLNVTKSHLGIVGLIFSCQHKHWNLTCDGVTELLEKTKTADGLATVPGPIIAAGVVGATVFLIIVVIIIMFLVKRKKVPQIKPQPSLKPSSPPYITVGAPGSSAYATVELNDAPSGSKNITVRDAGGCACIENYVNNDENRSSSLTKEESNELSVAATSTDNPKNDPRVVVQHMIPKDNASHINELHIAIDKTKDMTVHNDETAI